MKRISITEAALLLAKAYPTVRDLVLRQKLAGGRDDMGRLYVDEAAVESYQRERQAASKAKRPGPLPRVA